MSDYEPSAWRFPEGLRKHTFLMWDWHQRFLDMASQVFNTSDVQFVCWAEGDIGFRKHDLLSGLLSDLRTRSSGSPACWWTAWMKVKGEPRYGAHFGCLTRDGCSVVEDYLNSLRTRAIDEGDPLGYLMGLDAFLYKTQGVEYNGVTFQAVHPLKGRR